MLLSRPAILRHMEEGSIVIDPFDEDNLGTNSYDVTLGNTYFRSSDPEWGLGLYNIWSETETRRVWGEPQEAKTLAEHLEDRGLGSVFGFHGIHPDDRVIIIPPGEMFLCHTEEFVGGIGSVTTEMKARSSMGRVDIQVCKCAGLGDVGYVNRWTMEITNGSVKHSIPLVVGRRLAQIVFYEVDPIEQDYVQRGKYQRSRDLDELRVTWGPQMMLPRLFDDREAIEAEERRSRDDALVSFANRKPSARTMGLSSGDSNGEEEVM